MELFSSIHQFLITGGDVLWVILWTSILLWSLIAEKIIYFRSAFPTQKQQWLNQWKERPEHHSSSALFIRQCIISEAKISMEKRISVIKMLIALCPLLGLLGTVTGMISVFDVMAITGTGNARAMASGVSQATIPTMAGMVIAISGLYFSKLIEQKVSKETQYLTDLLQYD
jgi:biopolymer transport protein ExbB